MAQGAAARLLTELRALDLPEGDYAVFGSGPLVARGLLREVHDLDVVARGAAWDRARELGPVRTAPEGDPVVQLEGGAIEVFGGWDGTSTRSSTTPRSSTACPSPTSRMC